MESRQTISQLDQELDVALAEAFNDVSEALIDYLAAIEQAATGS